MADENLYNKNKNKNNNNKNKFTSKSIFARTRQSGVSIDSPPEHGVVQLNHLVRASADEHLDHSRRNLLKSVGLVGVAAIGAGSASSVIAADGGGAGTAAANLIPAREAMEVLTAAEVEVLEAICDCLIPSDEHGPGAKEARAVHYIDRSLASHNSTSRHSYLIGLNAVNEYALQTQAKPFAQLASEQQETILRAMQENELDGFESGAASFFNLVRNHTIDGTFCDPYYGGNRNFIGWDLIQYPGVRLGSTVAEVAQGAALPANHQSAYDHAAFIKAASYMGGADDA